jgi:hypothetical protein
MAKELKRTDVSHSPDVLRLAEEVHRTQEPRVLVKEAEELAVVTPLSHRPARSSKRGRPLTKDDPLFGSIGSARSGIPGGVSGKKHHYLARAYRPR